MSERKEDEPVSDGTLIYCSKKCMGEIEKIEKFARELSRDQETLDDLVDKLCKPEG